MENETLYNGASIGQAVLAITAVSSWLGGIALVKGFWMTVLAIIIPPYAWYLFVEKFMQFFGIL